MTTSTHKPPERVFFLGKPKTGAVGIQPFFSKENADASLACSRKKSFYDRGTEVIEYRLHYTPADLSANGAV